MRPTFVATLIKCDIIFLNKRKMVEIWGRTIWHVLCALQAKLSTQKKPVSWLQHQSWNKSVPCVVQADQEMLLMPDDHEHCLCYLVLQEKQWNMSVLHVAPNSVTVSGLSTWLSLTGALYPSNAFCCTHPGCEDIQHRPLLVLVHHGSFIDFTIIHRPSQSVPRISSCLLPPSFPKAGFL